MKLSTAVSFKYFILELQAFVQVKAVSHVTGELCVDSNFNSSRNWINLTSTVPEC